MGGRHDPRCGGAPTVTLSNSRSHPGARRADGRIAASGRCNRSGLEMGLFFVSIAALMAASALGAMFLRNPVHCALSLVLALASLAVVFLGLGAEFVGWAQILVYVGAVAILIVFAILLTRGSESIVPGAVLSRSWWAGAGVSALLFLTLAGAILSSPAARKEAGEKPVVTVKEIGLLLMDRYVLPLELLALLLTVALIGAALVAMQEKGRK